MYALFVFEPGAKTHSVFSSPGCRRYFATSFGSV